VATVETEPNKAVADKLISEDLTLGTVGNRDEVPIADFALTMFEDNALEAALEETPLADRDPWLTVDEMLIPKLAGIDAIELKADPEIIEAVALERRELTSLGRVESDTTDAVSELLDWLTVGDDKEPRLRTLNVLELVATEEVDWPDDFGLV